MAIRQIMLSYPAIIAAARQSLASGLCLATRASEALLHGCDGSASCSKQSFGVGVAKRSLATREELKHEVHCLDPGGITEISRGLSPPRANDTPGNVTPAIPIPEGSQNHSVFAPRLKSPRCQPAPSATNFALEVKCRRLRKSTAVPATGE